MAMQKTLLKEVSHSGIALHTGSFTTISFKPAPANSGIVFVRKDLPNSKPVRASVENVIATVRGTSLGVGEAIVHTVEHVLAALAGFDVDNALIEIDAAEPPVGDGSSIMFMLKQLGVPVILG
ncbi:MAG TPA: UDP-3-O-acyl-N-acetylglucosamine deacetylase, partial [bacterium]|nr:UDP-3-O-acyl-N-acetylglucosamine deacetylase [bacterium]